MELTGMKTLILLRHAKSDYPIGVGDIDRPLNERGRRDAPEAGRWLMANVGVPDVVVRSPAKRVEQTWELVAPELSSVPPKQIIDPRIYEASKSDLLSVIFELPDEARTALLIGHNPGLVDLATLLTHTADEVAAKTLADKFPTSAIAVFDVTRAWQAIQGGHLAACVIPRG
jgi:phosphohistidine phosphatase